MARPQQSRSQKTRANLIAAAEEVIARSGYGGMRVEEVVLRAGVAKGTFFAHFRDKDALMDHLIGARIAQHLDQLAGMSAPASVRDMISALGPLLRFMSSERYVFDLIMRYSGAAAVEEIGDIARTFDQQAQVIGNWLAECEFRRDIPVELQAEGVMAFLIQAVALHFCALHSSEAIAARLERYLDAWLTPGNCG